MSKSDKKKRVKFSPDPLVNSIELYESGFHSTSWVSICLFSIEPNIDHGHNRITKCALMGLILLLFTDCVSHNVSLLKIGKLVA